MTYLFPDARWTVGNLADWLDRNIPHPDITPEESGIFLTRLVQALIDERGFTLDQLVHDKYRLRRAVSAKINEYRKAAHGRAYQQLLFENSGLDVSVSSDLSCIFKPNSYPYSFLFGQIVGRPLVFSRLRLHG